jgi:segregation and condensation protein B
VVAYRQPISRGQISSIRAVNVDGVVSGLVERGLVVESGRENEFGAIRYRTTPLFERVFGLESLAALPRLDDLGADVTEIRTRLETVAEKRPE